MIWVDYEYYTESYRMGAPPVIPEEMFLFIAKRAQAEINAKNIVLEDIPDFLKDCVCEVAELLHNQDVLNDAENVRSYSNDGYSESYGGTTMTQADKDKGIRDIVQKHLAFTWLHSDFVYRGVR